MSEIENLSRSFWSAAYFLRRATNRDQTTALAVLNRLSTSTVAAIQQRAANTLKEYNVKPSSA